MLAEVPVIVVDAGVIASVVIAFGGAVAVLSRAIRASAQAFAREMDERIQRHVEPIQAVLHSLDTRLAKVEAEVTPNGGQSLKDQVTRIDERASDY